MNETPAPTVRLDRQDALAVITLARPQTGNAMDLQLCRELRAAAEALAGATGVRAILLRAEGRAFCVGGDLAAFAAAGTGRSTMLQTMAGDLHVAQALLMEMDAPVVAAVQGAAAGAGFSLAVGADLVLAARSASFTVAYTAVGLSADGGATYALPRLVGLRRAQELMFLNRRLSAEEAQAWGLVTAVVDDEALAAEAEALARRLAAGPTRAFGAVKRLLAASERNDFRAQTALEGALISALAGEPDAAEGIEAFRGKRPAAFRG